MLTNYFQIFTTNTFSLVKITTVKNLLRKYCSHFFLGYILHSIAIKSLRRFCQ